MPVVQFVDVAVCFSSLSFAHLLDVYFVFLLLWADGQTGSGKTYTVIGESSVHDHSTAGIIPRALADMFQRLEAKQRQQQQQQQEQTPPAAVYDDGDPARQQQQPQDDDDDSDLPSYVVKLQFLELYGEEIRDLLVNHSLASGGGSSSNGGAGGGNGSGGGSGGRHKLAIREVNGEPEVVGATQQVVQTPQEALLALTHGMVRRVTGATAMNSSSSRSHAILTVFVEQQSSTQLQVSKFQFVDLAGSERQKRTGAQGKRLKEGIDINKGLLVLGNVISALASNSPFVPYRDSKLTRMLQGSLGGNHKTLMIACVSPSPANFDESLNCLRYANRAKNITNQARVNTSSLNLEKVVDQLQSQLGVLARTLLHAADKGYSLRSESDNREGSESEPDHPILTREALQALARGQILMESGGGSVAGRRGSPSNGFVRASVGGAATPLSGSRSANLLSPTSSVRGFHPDADREVSKLRAALQESQQNQDAAERELYNVKAQKQVLELRIASSGSTPALSSDSTAPPDNAHTSFDENVVQKVMEYEQEIGQLKQALRQAEQRNLTALADWNADDGDQQASAMQRFYAGVEEDRRKLERLRTEIGVDAGDAEQLSLDTPRTRLEKEDNAEEAQLQGLTRKYLSEDDEDDETQPRDHSEPDVAAGETPLDSSHIRADLVELSRNIAAKEDLIGQLRLSQEKYAVR
jgi:Kinesin motor domain